MILSDKNLKCPTKEAAPQKELHKPSSFFSEKKWIKILEAASSYDESVRDIKAETRECLCFVQNPAWRSEKLISFTLLFSALQIAIESLDVN